MCHTPTPPWRSAAAAILLCRRAARRGLLQPDPPGIRRIRGPSSHSRPRLSSLEPRLHRVRTKQAAAMSLLGTSRGAARPAHTAPAWASAAPQAQRARPSQASSLLHLVALNLSRLKPRWWNPSRLASRSENPHRGNPSGSMSSAYAGAIPSSLLVPFFIMSESVYTPCMMSRASASIHLS